MTPQQPIRLGANTGRAHKGFEWWDIVIQKLGLSVWKGFFVPQK